MNNYFSHDSNARDDENILAMRADLGWEAYGIYWAIVEMLRDATDYRLKTNYKVLAFSLHTSEDLITRIIKDYGLFCISEDQQFFFSRSLAKRMEEKEVVSKKRRAAAGTRWAKDTSPDATGMQKQCTDDANASPKESKVKESKVNYSSPRTREGACSPNEEEKKKIYEIFFWRNMKNPLAEVERFWAHNQQYGWKLYDTQEKRMRAAQEWIPENTGDRVSKRFLEMWKSIYAKLSPDEERLKEYMLHDGSRLSVNNGSLVIHAHGSLHNVIATRGSREIELLAKGNPVRYTWP